jgi:hypothetical protein
MSATKAKAFINLLTEKTIKGDCQWEDDSRGFNRLILNNGSVIFEYSYDEMVENYHYTIKLYDTTEQFASYCVDFEDNYDEDLFKSMDNLRLAIEGRKDEIIDSKIQKLYDELT